MADIEKAISVRSSANVDEDTFMPYIHRPWPLSSSSLISPSMKARYSMGELRPPCFVPYITGKLSERNSHYLTWQLASLYMERKAVNVEPSIPSVMSL